MYAKRSLNVLIISLVLLTSLVFVPTAYAFDGREGQTITIGKNEVIADDLYLTAQYVVVDGTIQGDLMVGAVDIVINGTVEGDLWATGSSLTLNGEVGDDVFFAGAAATFGSESTVGDDVFLGGFSLEARPGSQIGGSVLMGAFQGLLSGDVAENLLAGASRIRIEGVISGDVKVDVANVTDTPGFNLSFFGLNMPVVPSVPAGLTLGSDADIAGSLTYTSREAFSLDRDRIQGSVQHLLPRVEAEVTTKVRNTPARMLASWMFDNVRRTITFIVIGLLLAWLLPGWVTKPADRLQAKPLPSFGWGLVVFILFPLVILTTIGLVIATALVMGALTLGGLVSAVLSLGSTTIFAAVSIYILVLSFLTKTAVAYVGGRYLLNRINPDYTRKVVWPLLLGLLILAFLFAVPFLGWLMEFVVMLFGLGAIFMLLLDRLSPAHKPLPAASAE